MAAYGTGTAEGIGSGSRIFRLLKSAQGSSVPDPWPAGLSVLDAGLWCATGGDGIVGEWSRAELEEHVRDEHSTFTWLLGLMTDRAGFEVEEALHSDDGIFAQYLLRAV